MAHELLEETSALNLPMSVDIHSLHLTDEQFYQLCLDNSDLRFELTSKGELIIMPPTGYSTGWSNSKLIYQLTDWTLKDGTGRSFDSSTLFVLPNGAKRSPDACWVSLDRAAKLTDKEKKGFAPVCPNFVVELRSPSDSLQSLQEKMNEYIENGSELGFLLDPSSKSVYIYRPGRPVEHLENPDTVSGD